jgi:feruloyl-CoA synthase
LLAALAQRLGALNDGTKAASMRVERLALLAEPPSVDGYELTDKGSINQRAVIERRAADVTALFAEPCPAAVLHSARS